LRQHVLLRIHDRRLPLADRTRAIRLMAHAGYATGADALIGLLGDPSWLNKAEVVAALEDVSGQTLGDNPAAWQAWWGSLPPGVRRPEQAEPPVVAIPLREANPESSSAPVVASIVAEQSDQSEVSLKSAPPPLELKICWGMMLVGGFVALLIPISVLFHSGPVVWPALYFGLAVGCLALARGAARDTDGLTGAAAFQVANIVACDPVNFVLGIIEQRLLKRPHVAQYLVDVRRAPV
jgi:hypothetical protein